MNRSGFGLISLSCFLLSIAVWVPNIVFQVGSPAWLLTFVFGPIGILFGALGRNYLLVAGNVFMGFSFFIFMAIGYWVNSFAG